MLEVPLAHSVSVVVGEGLVQGEALTEPLTQRVTVGEREREGLPEGLTVRLPVREMSPLALLLPLLLLLTVALPQPLVVALRHSVTLPVDDRLGDMEVLKVPVMELVSDCVGDTEGEALRHKDTVPLAESEGDSEGEELRHSVGETLADLDVVCDVVLLTLPLRVMVLEEVRDEDCVTLRDIEPLAVELGQ